MLELARARCAGDLLELDMRGLAPPAASFDLVWPIASLLQLPKAEGEAAGVLREFRRFVKPDGAVVIRSSAARASGGNRWARPRGDSLARYEPEELRAALAAAGLVADAVEQTTSDRDEEWLLATAVPAG
jgi:SAM-dependent methyltransferase